MKEKVKKELGILSELVSSSAAQGSGAGWEYRGTPCSTSAGAEAEGCCQASHHLIPSREKSLSFIHYGFLKSLKPLVRDRKIGPWLGLNLDLEAASVFGCLAPEAPWPFQSCSETSAPRVTKEGRVKHLWKGPVLWAVKTLTKAHRSVHSPAD